MELKITDLTKSFRDLKAVDHVSYTFGSGVYGLLGVNGAGKTTAQKKEGNVYTVREEQVKEWTPVFL